MMKVPMPAGGEVKMGGHMSKEPKLDRDDTSKLKMDDKPKGHTRPASKADQLRSGGPGVGACGGATKAVSYLNGLKK